MDTTTILLKHIIPALEAARMEIESGRENEIEVSKGLSINKIYNCVS